MERRIGFGRRLGAYLIDIVFIIGSSFILASLFGDFFERFVDFSKVTDEQLAQMDALPGNFGDIMLTIGAAAGIFAFLYNLVEGLLGYTVGKLMLGIQIGNQDGTPADTGKLMLRFAIKNSSSIIGLIGMAAMVSLINSIGSAIGIVVIIGCFFALGEKKLALHDLIAKTAVFRKSELEDGTAAEPIMMPPSVD